MNATLSIAADGVDPEFQTIIVQGPFDRMQDEKCLDRTEGVGRSLLGVMSRLVWLRRQFPCQNLHSLSRGDDVLRDMVRDGALLQWGWIRKRGAMSKKEGGQSLSESSFVSGSTGPYTVCLL